MQSNETSSLHVIGTLDTLKLEKSRTNKKMSIGANSNPTQPEETGDRDKESIGKFKSGLKEESASGHDFAPAPSSGSYFIGRIQ